MVLSVLRDGVPKLRGDLARLTHDRVLVGVPAEEALRRPEPGEKSGPINNAALAWIHDHGAPGANIPARPFMGPGIANVQPAVTAEFRRCASSLLSGAPVDVTVTLRRVGLIAQDAIKLKINIGPFIPLAPATLAARRRRGRTGTTPLIDSAQMRNSITFVIRSARTQART